MINRNWRFLLEDSEGLTELNYWDKEYEDKDWEKVTLPHDWAVAHPFLKEYSSGTGYLPGGIGWYRHRFKLPKIKSGQKVWIVFDGVYKNSQVWCNNYYMGKWATGYTPFRYDITDQVNFGEIENVIAVKVTHKDIADSRWYTGSGITRNVIIVIDNLLHIEPGSLTFITSNINDNKAEIKINMTLINELDKELDAEVMCKLVDETGATAAVLKSSIEVIKYKKADISITGTVNNPNLWSSESPHLYKLLTTVTGGNYEPVVNEQIVGIREFYFDPDKGFFINGKNTLLKGVCIHHDAGCLGAAVAENIWARRLEKFKTMGCNAIRCSHNPHMAELYQLCNRIGFYVIDEAFDEWEGPKNKWLNGHNVYPPGHQGYSEDFPQWHKKDLEALIRRDKNNPSVIMWSIGNEIDYPNDPYCHPLFKEMTGNNDANKPSEERMYNPNRPNMDRMVILAKQLVKIVKKEDKTRPVTMALAFPELSTQIGIMETLDVVGYNYKEDKYELDHKKFPTKPLFGSENSHSYRAWMAARDNDYIAGQFLWTGIDFLGEARGWPIHGSGAGLLTLAGFEKPEYYFRQSLWSIIPMAKLVTAENKKINEYEIFSPLWNYQDGEKVIVRCYTNMEQVELFCNNASFGIKKRDKKTGYIEWNINYKPGNLEVKALDNKEDVLDIIETSSTAQIIDLITWNNKFGTNKKDMVQIEVTVKDALNIPVYNDSTKLFITINGDAELAGIENGDLSDNTEYSACFRRVYHGKMIIYIRVGRSKDVTISVSGEGLKTAYLAI